MKNLVFLFVGLLLFTSCGDENVNQTATKPETTVEKDTISEKPMNLVAHSHNVLLAIASKDFHSLSGFVHPEKGVRFSMYAYIHDEYLVATPEQLSDEKFLDSIQHWGEIDASGEPIDLPIEKYFEQWVYDVDYLTADTLAVNEFIGFGNSLNNLESVYPNADFVEYHFSGFDPEFDGMDWRSLRLVYELLDNKYYLVAIVNDRWTI